MSSITRSIRGFLLAYLLTVLPALSQPLLSQVSAIFPSGGVGAGGDVSGPGAGVCDDNDIIRSDGTTGTDVQCSDLTLLDASGGAVTLHTNTPSDTLRLQGPGHSGEVLVQTELEVEGTSTFKDDVLVGDGSAASTRIIFDTSNPPVNDPSITADAAAFELRLDAGSTNNIRLNTANERLVVHGNGSNAGEYYRFDGSTVDLNWRAYLGSQALPAPVDDATVAAGIGYMNMENTLLRAARGLIAGGAGVGSQCTNCAVMAFGKINSISQLQVVPESFNGDFDPDDQPTSSILLSYGKGSLDVVGRNMEMSAMTSDGADISRLFNLGDHFPNDDVPVWSFDAGYLAAPVGGLALGGNHTALTDGEPVLLLNYRKPMDEGGRYPIRWGTANPGEFAELAVDANGGAPIFEFSESLEVDGDITANLGDVSIVDSAATTSPALIFDQSTPGQARVEYDINGFMFKGSNLDTPNVRLFSRFAGNGEIWLGEQEDPALDSALQNGIYFAGAEGVHTNVPSLLYNRHASFNVAGLDSNSFFRFQNGPVQSNGLVVEAPAASYNMTGLASNWALLLPDSNADIVMNGEGAAGGPSIIACPWAEGCTEDDADLGTNGSGSAPNLHPFLTVGVGAASPFINGPPSLTYAQTEERLDAILSGDNITNIYGGVYTSGLHWWHFRNSALSVEGPLAVATGFQGQIKDGAPLLSLGTDVNLNDINENNTWNIGWGDETGQETFGIYAHNDDDFSSLIRPSREFTASAGMRVATGTMRMPYHEEDTLSAYDVTPDDSGFIYSDPDAVGGDQITYNLFSCESDSSGHIIRFKQVSPGITTIDPAGSETIDGFATYTLESENAAVMLHCKPDGTQPGWQAYEDNFAASQSPSFIATASSWTYNTQGVQQIIPFGNEVEDTHGAYDTGAYRFTPGVAGKYLVRAQVYAANGSSRNIVSILKNGTDEIFVSDREENNYDAHTFVMGTVNLDADDYVEAYYNCIDTPCSSVSMSSAIPGQSANSFTGVRIR